ELWAEMGMRMRSGPVSALLDRQGERAALDGLLDDVRAGRGGGGGGGGGAGGGGGGGAGGGGGGGGGVRGGRGAGGGRERGGGRGGRNRRWSGRSPACTSCVRRCWIGWRACRVRSAPRWGSRSGCGRGVRRTGFWSGWRC